MILIFLWDLDVLYIVYILSAVNAIWNKQSAVKYVLVIIFPSLVPEKKWLRVSKDQYTDYECLFPTAWQKDAIIWFEAFCCYRLNGIIFGIEIIYDISHVIHIVIRLYEQANLIEFWSPPNEVVWKVGLDMNL